jgi:hypothetical protein
MEILGKILGSPARVKIMRLFMSNRSQVFKAKDVSARSRVSAEVTRKELNLLSSVGFIKKKGEGYMFDPSFKYGEEMDSLLVSSNTFNKENIAETFKKAGGKVKFLAVSGLFIKNKDSRVDLLIVGDKMKKTKIEEGIKKLEAELGAELVYAQFETKEFIYRLNMYDKLVRDILDFPHEVVLETKELSTQTLKKA